MRASTKETFEIIGSFAADVMCNQHFQMARSRVDSGKHPSVTEAYLEIVRQYGYSITKKHEVYQGFVKNLQEYYNKCLKYAATMTQFEDRIISEFVPPDYFSQFTWNDKDRLMNRMITTTMAELCQFCQQGDIVKLIIDKRSRDTGIVVKKRAIDALARQREEYYNEFANQIVRQANGGGVDHDVHNKLVEKWKTETRARIDLEAKVEKLTKMVKVLDRENQDLRQENDQIRAEFSRSRAQSQSQSIPPAPEPTPTPAATSAGKSGKKPPQPVTAASFTPAPPGDDASSDDSDSEDAGAADDGAGDADAADAAETNLFWSG